MNVEVKSEIVSTSNNLLRLANALDSIKHSYVNLDGVMEHSLHGVWSKYRGLAFSLFSYILPTAHQFYQDLSVGERYRAEERMKDAMNNNKVQGFEAFNPGSVVEQIKTGELDTPILGRKLVVQSIYARAFVLKELIEEE